MGSGYGRQPERHGPNPDWCHEHETTFVRCAEKHSRLRLAHALLVNEMEQMASTFRDAGWEDAAVYCQTYREQLASCEYDDTCELRKTLEALGQA